MQVDNNIMAQSPCFLLPLPIPSPRPFLLPFTYLETLLDVIGSRPPWSQVTRELTSPFSTPPHPSPLQIPSIPSQIPQHPAPIRRQLDSGFQDPEHQGCVRNCAVEFKNKLMVHIFVMCFFIQLHRRKIYLGHKQFYSR
jgi:hypothetical protein